MTEFIYVTKKRKKKNVNKTSSNLSLQLKSQISLDESPVELCVRRILDAKNNIANTFSFQILMNSLLENQFNDLTLTSKSDCTDHIDSRPSDMTAKSISGVSSIVSYGLGSLSACHIVRQQTALLLLIAEHLGVSVEAYDPVFTASDKKILETFGVKIIFENEEGKRVVNLPTLFYMPHCGKAMYNNLLWANWCKCRLTKLVIIGNSFSTINCSTPSREMIKYYEYIKKADGVISEFPLGELVDSSDIFRCTSVHVFSCVQINEIMDEEFWIKNDLVYDDSPEFVQCDT